MIIPTDPTALLEGTVPAPLAARGYARVRDIDRRELRHIEQMLGDSDYKASDPAFRAILRSLVATMALRGVRKADRLSYRDLEQIIKRAGRRSSHG